MTLFRFSKFALLFIVIVLAQRDVLARESGPRRPECFSLFGEPLYAPELSPFANKSASILFDIAKTEFQNDECPSPGDPLKAVWLGRRTAYLNRYNESVDIFSRAIDLRAEKGLPGFAPLYRFRGHRLLTIRKFEAAVADLQKAFSLLPSISLDDDLFEADGSPNKYNLPVSTLITNILYHLGLGLFLLGRWEQAGDVYAQLLDLAAQFSKSDLGTDDMFVSSLHWTFMALQRLGRFSEASTLLESLPPDPSIVEDQTYQRLTEMYRGLVDPEQVLKQAEEQGGIAYATMVYGVGSWYFCQERRDEAVSLWKSILESYPDQWPSFGYIAAEADLFRLLGKDSDHLKSGSLLSLISS
uniref:Tetratricopeptide repeat protein n=1 Tax=Chromera velia CCMP2878 TaxID=1169474 RepID=A0A0G4HJV8_9ALVE|eukprot:Cvel_28294.t1-p1 / transcript=Cvel_28294.t1 / gene=Cvel_28294 / organism=Chromera_velia_CCMP2878 / gene_product=hypothetical protein / transcript_product=hypothetical protein / location=Cvel_scaffold3670:10377-12723(-) / protein_length=355 / sequence_SO=supercontig / SO=protein_coding / is_pseudo=false